MASKPKLSVRSRVPKASWTYPKRTPLPKIHLVKTIKVQPPPANLAQELLLYLNSVLPPK